MEDHRRFAYFCMEIGFNPDVPTYAGGLGILAGDTLRSAADVRLPIVGVSLLHRKGYFKQILDDTGMQREEPLHWVVEDFMKEVAPRVTVTVEGRTVHVRAWQHDLIGSGGYRVPIFFLDTYLEENSDWDRTLTHYLYGGDQHYRLCQEIVLGAGGVRMLRTLGYRDIERFHINEGHASLLAVELLDESLRESGREAPTPDEVEAVRRNCVFTTHTPVPAGHDQFPAEMAVNLLEPRQLSLVRRLGCLDGVLNMTHLALRLSRYVNGVSRRHGEVSRELLAPHPVDSITNGVHARMWISPRHQELFDRYLGAWREDSLCLRQALRVPNHELWDAHVQAKRQLLEHVHRATNIVMDRDVFTIGFARRAATYKRADLFFHDIERLKRIHREVGPMQIIYAGKAHGHDQGAKELIRRVFQARDALKNVIPVAYLPDYDMHTCGLMTAGVDLWLNTPKAPLEASGTSGMKAAMNGVPSLSVIDGWWVEGWIEGITGWAIGRDREELDPHTERGVTASQIYDKLEYVVLPKFYHQRDRYIDVMRLSIAINGSYFCTQRMVQQYAVRAYLR